MFSSIWGCCGIKIGLKHLCHLPVYSPQYQIFIPMVNKVMLKHRVNHQRYDVLICRIVKVSVLPPRAYASNVKKHIFGA